MPRHNHHIMRQNFYNNKKSKTATEAILDLKQKLYGKLEKDGEMQGKLTEILHEFEFKDFEGQKFKVTISIEPIK
jgi:hypothetical protein